LEVSAWVTHGPDNSSEPVRNPYADRRQRPVSVWTVTGDEIRRLQGRDIEFTALLNELLGAATAGHMPPTALRFNVKTQAPDGGVDAAIDGVVPATHDQFGLLAVPTCWQFKACSSDHIKPSRGQSGGQEVALRTEIQKTHARQLIARGYGYRLCIADPLTPQQRQRWEGWLLDESRKINLQAPAPTVVPADLLADWCSCHPGVVIRLRPFLAAVHDFRTWDRTASAQSPTFVPVEIRRGVSAAIRGFADLTQPARNPVLTVAGEAGVGKTRCVLEALRPLPGIPALVVATDDERTAVELIQRLMNDRTSRAVFVVDGMDVATRARLCQLLTADVHRLRVIAIDNERREVAAAEGEVRLGPLDRQEVERILAANFPAVPNETRWAIAGLADGFVRLAVDVCRHIHLLPAGGDMVALLPIIRDQYLAARLTDEQRAVVELVSLMARVGYRGDPGVELRALCAAIPAAGLTPEQVITIAAGLRQAPGFIAVGPRYLYVTPRVVAQAAFHSGWERWIRTNPEAFFGALPVELEDALYRQIRHAGTAQARRLVTAFHESWVRRLGPDNLADPDAMYRLFRLVEVEPETLLPYLADLIDSATPDQLAGLDRLPDLRRSRRDRWEARRRLVWLAEWLLRFPEFYPFAQRILYRLALTETENCGNNAMGIWCQTYRLFLSGTPVSFADRLARLECRFDGALTDAETRLCLRGLVGPLTADGPSHRMGSPPLVSGRIPPPDWSPVTWDELHGVWRATVDLLARLVRHPNPAVSDGVVDTAIRNGIGLIRRHLQDFVAVVEFRPIGEARRVAILELLERFLQVYCRPDRRMASADTEAAVRAWRQRLLPAALHDRLRTTIRRAYYDLHSYLEDHGETELSSLARELLAQPSMLFAELSWLYSTEARSAHALGMHLGRLDEHGDLLDPLANSAVGRTDAAFLRGYVVGLLDNRPTLAARVSGVLDRLTPDHPDLVFELLTTGLTSLDSLGRTLALVDAGLIPVTHLRLFWRLVGTRTLTTDELTAVLTRMLAAARGGNAEAGRGAVDVLLAQVHACHREGRAGGVFDGSRLPLVRCVLEVSLTSDLGQEGYGWGEVLTELGRAEPVEAIRLAVAALGSDNSVALSDATEGYLTAAAPLHPEALMSELGSVLLDPHRGIRVRAHDLTPVLRAMPVCVVQEWVNRNGLCGARAITRLLPAPFLHEGVPTVPELTAFVLDQFGDDEEVFDEFCMGARTHSVRVGDIAADYDRDAVVARAFRTHRSRWVREWARAAEESARGSAEWWRVDDEEMEAP
jgi:hypothetical protein